MKRRDFFASLSFLTNHFANPPFAALAWRKKQTQLHPKFGGATV